MIVLVLLFLLTAGALASVAVSTRRRGLHLAISLIPGVAALLLVLPLPIPPDFSFSWTPSGLFRDSLSFAASSQANSFAFYFCVLLFLLEWTRPLRGKSGRMVRASVFLLSLAAVLAGYASNPLSVFITWSLIDFLSLLAVSAGSPPVEIGASGVSSSLEQALVVFATNALGSALVLCSLFCGGPVTFPLSFSAVAGGLSILLFLGGVSIRLIATPVLISLSPARKKGADTDILLRTASPAAALCLLSDSRIVSIFPSDVSPAILLPLLAIFVVVAWRWFSATDPSEHRDFFFLTVPGFALFSGLLAPEPRLFVAAGAMLILGGGVLMTHIGFLKNRSWLTVFPAGLGVLTAGIPLTPFSVWASAVYPALAEGGRWSALILMILLHILLIGALFRSAFDPVDAFPSNEPFFLLSFSVGAAVGLAGLLYPGWPTPDFPVSIGLPVALLGCAIGTVLLFRRLQQSGRGSRWLHRDPFLRLDRPVRGAVFLFRSFSAAVSGLESFLSGEGAMLWSLGIALLIYLMLRGG